MARPNRKHEILQALAEMLETNPGARITTAALARRLGASESALYRHFPSKARMFEGLIAFAEDTVFSRIDKILDGAPNAETRCGGILLLLLHFCETNPGFARLFAGDALQGESERLRQRTGQFYDRIEATLRQVLRTASLERPEAPPLGPNEAANLLLASAEGRINQFVRSEFKAAPTRNWKAQWQALARAAL